MSTRFEVRPATAADVPAVLPMVRAICALHEHWDPERYPMLPDVVERYRRWLPERAADPESVFLVAQHQDGSSLVGFLIGTVEENIPIYRVARYGFIHDVWVDPSARRSGVASALVENALGRFRAIDVAQVRLETAVPNDDARALFARAGFQQSVVEMLRTID